MDPRLNLDAVNALPVILPEYEEISLFLVGCGGTGSWLAPSVIRIARLLRELHQKVSVTFVDFDHVEPGNIPRQNFTDADLGLNKAEVLSLRYGLAWGIEVKAVPRSFEPNLLGHGFRHLTIILGCVDRASARQSIAKLFPRYCPGYGNGQYRWWLDCGNAETSGQVLLGCCSNKSDLVQGIIYPSSGSKKATRPIFVGALPAPHIQHPELLEERVDEKHSQLRSCREITLENAQSLVINQRVATEAAALLNDLLLVRQLKIFAAYFDLKAHSANARYITPTNILSYFPD
ncbi:ThiF family adenylyltransferase [Leptolyngbya sp. AN03gr2]|uniref:ThiF family adenylyltransferase n=1 Tax=unclassified Leptolyngbya TaxID=2650499 RepID=UPI003D318232